MVACEKCCHCVVSSTSSQSLVNLLLVGLAITNVFDLDKDLGGISELRYSTEYNKTMVNSSELRGVPHQSAVGFLTILEALRYCEVLSPSLY